MADTSRVFPTKGGVTATGHNGMFGYVFGKPGPTGYGSASTAEQVAKGWDGTGQTVIVTGSSPGGLGFESARVLASRGAEVIIAVRNAEKGKEAVDLIKAQYPSAVVHFMKLDLASLKSVKSFADEFKATGKPLNILLNNAAVMACPFTLSADGHEMQFATNHLGHFHLTNLLLDTMLETARKQNREGRIVSVSSAAHFRPYKEGIRFDALDSPEGYSSWSAYGQSKLANILFIRQLNEKLAGQPVVAVTNHPGGISTNLQRHTPSFADLVMLLFRPLMKSIPQGAATQVYLCTAPKVEGGEYYADCNINPSSRYAHSKELASKLWATSEQLVSKAMAEN